MIATAAGVRFRAFVRSFFRYEERLTPSQWVERHVRLPPGKQETEPGRVSFKTRPHLREPLDSFADPTLTDIVIVSYTRGGKTFVLRMVFCWSVAGDPAPMLWIDIDEDKAKDISKKEIQPLIEYNECLRARKPANRHNFTDLRMLFPAAAFTMGGGQAVSQVAGDNVKRILGNELDKWHGKTDKEASIPELARHRTESFDDERKHGWGCTPTIEEMPTWQYHNRGDQRRWFGPCPRCGTFQQLVWRDETTGAGVVWDPQARIASGKWDFARVKASARYSCVNTACTAHDSDGTRGTGLNDDERRALIQDERAHWRPTAIGQPGWRSYQFNGLYGPKKSNNCGELAVDFLSARTTGFYADRQDFWNSRMGLPWRDEITLITAKKFADREKSPGGQSYLRGEMPAGWRPNVVIIGADVQANRLPYVVAAADWAGNACTIDHGDAPTWKDLEQVQNDYRKLGATSYVIIDINYEDRRAETLEQIYFRRDRGWYGAEGVEFARDLVRLEHANVYAGGKLQGKREDEQHKIVKLVISTYQFKVELEKRFAGKIANWFSYQLPLAAEDREREEQADYYAQLLDERRVPRRIRISGKPPFEFKARTKNNHFFDGWVYILALFWVLQKKHSFAARKRLAAAGETRKVIEVKR
jgi:hypothetical protein